MLLNKKIFCCVAFMLVLILMPFLPRAQSAGTGYYYQIKIYHFKTQAQENTLDSYLKTAYLPLLHKKGFNNIGVFKPVETDTADRKIYFFTQIKNWKTI
jgi:hypothetical protein